MLIAKIENPELKQEYLKRLRKLITQENHINHSKPKICINTTLEKFKKINKEVTIQDLQHEVKNIKTEIILLKEQNLELKSENLEIKQDINFLKIDSQFHKLSPDEGAENSQEKTISLVNQIRLKKWHTRVKITDNKNLCNQN